MSTQNQARRTSATYHRRSFTFPGGARKAVILSYDDGLIQDRRLVDVLNRFGLKGTFHLVSGFLDTQNDWLIDVTGERAQYLRADELATLFAGHEVSSHSVTHPGLTSVSDQEVLRQVDEDRRTLQQLTGQPVLSHAYPFGDHDDRVVDLLKGTSLLAARTGGQSGAFALPQDLLRWEPTAHHLNAMPHIDRFLALEDGQPALLLIAGHSWEFDIGKGGNDWALIETICERLGAEERIWSAGLGEVAQYLVTVRDLEEGPEGQVNHGDTAVWVRDGDALVRLEPADR